MNTLLPLLAEQLQLIERELRGLGGWQSSPPEPEALASEQPFCVDTLEFEQWLQWIFLPRMQALLSSGAPLPSSCAIAPMAEMAFAQRLAPAQTLLSVLGEFDRLLQAHAAAGAVERG